MMTSKEKQWKCPVCGAMNKSYELNCMQCAAYPKKISISLI